jgi:sarcosine oxidase
VSLVVETQVLVLGLGAVGAAVAYQLERRGVDFLALERQPAAGHGFGSSHGESRITREAVGEGLDYIALVKRSHEIVAELEAAGAPRLREECGVLYLSSGGLGALRHGAADFLAATRAAGEAGGVELVELDAAAIRAAYPQFEVPDDTVGLLEARAGLLRPERCIAAQLAGIAPGKLRFGETVLELAAATGGGVEVTTGAGVYRGAQAVVAMGAWTPGFVGEPFRREVKVLRQALHWFATEPGGPWADGGGPVFLWFHGAGEGDVFYGFPVLAEGRAGVKVATEQYAQACEPDAVDWTVSQDESRAMFEAHVRGRLAGVSAARIDAKACLYTWNGRSDEDGHQGRFLIGPHASVPGVTVVSACSGHGFKHSLGLGDALARQLLDEPEFCDLSVFAP